MFVSALSHLLIVNITVFELLRKQFKVGIKQKEPSILWQHLCSSVNIVTHTQVFFVVLQTTNTFFKNSKKCIQIKLQKNPIAECLVFFGRP